MPRLTFCWPFTLFARSAPKALGPRGESLAANYVAKTLHFKLLNQNVRCPGGELDLIALDGNDIVIIEVRTRSSSDFGSPERSITPAKQHFLRRSARWFIRTRKLEQFTLRFDLIAIEWPDDSKPVIRYHRNFMTLT